uniref:DNA-directed RNA polymerase n=1 Tax=Borodinellopsis insignis TaxID=3229915 RepID=A0AB39U3T6_9CHLO
MFNKPAVFEGQWVQSGDLLADGAASVGGELSLGQNLLIAYMPWEGYNYEDAILVSERLVTDDLYTSIHIERYEMEIKETKLGAEEITRQIPDINHKEIQHLDNKGIVKIGSWVEEGDILVGKVTPINKKSISPYQKLLYTILEKQFLPTIDSSLRAPKGIKAKVIDIKLFQTNKISTIKNKKLKKKNWQTTLTKLKEPNQIDPKSLRGADLPYPFNRGEPKNIYRPIQNVPKNLFSEELRAVRRSPLKKLLGQDIISAPLNSGQLTTKLNSYKKVKSLPTSFAHNYGLKNFLGKNNLNSLKILTIPSRIRIRGSHSDYKRILKKNSNKTPSHLFGVQKVFHKTIYTNNLKAFKISFLRTIYKNKSYSSNNKRVRYGFSHSIQKNIMSRQYNAVRAYKSNWAPLLNSPKTFFPKFLYRGLRGRMRYAVHQHQLTPRLKSAKNLLNFLNKITIQKQFLNKSLAVLFYTFYVLGSYPKKKITNKFLKHNQHSYNNKFLVKTLKQKNLPINLEINSKFNAIKFKKNKELLVEKTERQKRAFLNFSLVFNKTDFFSKKNLFCKKKKIIHNSYKNYISPIFYKFQKKNGVAHTNNVVPFKRNWGVGNLKNQLNMNHFKTNFTVSDNPKFKHKKSLKKSNAPLFEKKKAPFKNSLFLARRGASRSLPLYPYKSYGFLPNKTDGFPHGLPQNNVLKNFIQKVHIYLAEKRKIQVGDKMAGRHGNKGIISQILPIEDMPYLPDGTPIDMVLNPLGVPSRMNVGQIYECLLGLAGKYLGENFKVFPFDETYGPEASRSWVFSKLYEASLKTRFSWLFDPNSPGKMRLYDGRTGECFNQPITVGYAYMLKLVHMVDDKIHARSTGPYSLVTQQPLRGRSKMGGQRLGEMEVWALEGYGAAFILLEMLTIKSDDMTGRMTLWSNLILNKNLKIGTPESFKVLICELQALCLDIGLYRFNEGPYNLMGRLRSENSLNLQPFNAKSSHNVDNGVYFNKDCSTGDQTQRSLRDIKANSIIKGETTWQTPSSFEFNKNYANTDLTLVEIDSLMNLP